MGSGSLSPAVERKLLAALDEMTGHISRGDNPTEALSKVAQAQQLLPGYVQLVAQTYNVSQCNLQRESADDVLEKTADFPMADAADVVERMFPKAASQQVLQTFADNWKSADYAAPPTDYKDRLAKLEARRHGLEEPLVGEIKAKPKARKLPAGEHETILKHAAAVASSNLAQAEVLVEQVFKKLGQYYQNNAHKFEMQAEQGRRLWGELFLPIRKEMEYSWGGWLSKRAAVSGPKPTYPEDVDYSATPYREWNELIETLPMLSELARLSKEAEARFDAYWNPEPEPWVPTKSAAQSWADLTSDVIVNPAMGGASNLLAALTPTKENLVSDLSDKLDDPDHEQQLDAINTNTMLNDLMANDEVISGYDSADVLRAYNQMASAAPKAIRNPVVAQGLLRRYLVQGAMDPFETEQAMKLETRFRDLHNTTPSDKPPEPTNDLNS